VPPEPPAPPIPAAPPPPPWPPPPPVELVLLDELVSPDELDELVSPDELLVLDELVLVTSGGGTVPCVSRAQEGVHTTTPPARPMNKKEERVVIMSAS
jgi:hypothetical protein